jgi:hypothetical protein
MTQPKPGDAGTSGASAVAAVDIDAAPPKKNVLQSIQRNVSQAARRKAGVNNKMQIVGVIRQHAAELFDMAASVGTESEKLTEASSNLAGELFNARVSGVFTNDEINGLLGDVFGYRETSTGNPSKTPDGQGKAIRDRVFRLVKANDYSQTGEGDRFFQSLEREEVAEIVAAVESGETSLWTAYDTLTDMRRDNLPPRIDPAYDPKRVAALVGKLTEAGAAEILANNPALCEGYMALLDVLNLYGFIEAWRAEQKAAA